jgi:glutamate synthase domain-containing protein 2
VVSKRESPFYHLHVITSGKALSAFSILKYIALGGFSCNSAKGSMFSLGCIQALRCNTNDCPTGRAMQKTALKNGLVVTDKSAHVCKFHKNTVDAAKELSGVSEPTHSFELTIND